jgi:hypothetical protein
VIALPLVEIAAYAVIALAALLAVGGAAFLWALSVYERIENWLVGRGRAKR